MKRFRCMNTELLKRFSDKLQEKQICVHVVGDSILDENYQVKVNRISPECPNVNILLSENDKPFQSLPGGAANVCYQLNNFNIKSRLFTFVDTEAYQIISKEIKHWGHVILPDGHYIPRKKRYYERGFQAITRWDVEKINYGLNLTELQASLVEKWNQFEKPDVVIFSDYNKGLFSGNLRSEFFKTDAITIVDPKAAPIEKWEHCNVFKPNAKEAAILSGESDWKQQCDYFKKKVHCDAVVITQEGDGVVGKTDDYFEYRPNLVVKPVDIIGAGDCFIGMLGAALAHGFTVEEAATIAFHGGIAYVTQKQKGTFGPWAFHFSNKILNDYRVLKNRNYKLVFTNGCFDLFHSGHLYTLEAAKSKGDKLVVAVNDDDSIKRNKGENRPIIPLKERIKLLAALQCVDFVITFNEDTPQKLIEDIRPDVLVKGADWENKTVAGVDYAKEMCYISLLEGYSTSQIIEKIKFSYLQQPASAQPHPSQHFLPQHPPLQSALPQTHCLQQGQAVEDFTATKSL